ncbi:MAG: hypothetical protein ACREE9_01150 [Stellaceae bacterium]
MAAVVKCEHRALRPDGVLVVDQAEIAAGYEPEEDEEVFVFWHNEGPEKARLAMRGVLLPVTLLERVPWHPQKASLEVRVTEPSPSQQLLVNDLDETSELAADRSLCLKVRNERHTRIAPLELPEEIDYLRGKFHDLRPNNEIEAEEGYQGDRTIAFQHRNNDLIASCKARDDHRCLACEFRLELHGRYIIDCHHKVSFAGVPGVRVTGLNDLICLCPTCHRIAHTQKTPLTVEEIRAARQAAGTV